MADEPSQGTKKTLFGDMFVQLWTSRAELNAARLFYMDQTQPAFSPKLYDNGEDPQIRLNVKLAACLVMSEPSQGTRQRYDLTSAIDDLWRKVYRVLELSAQPCNSETPAQPCKGVGSVLEPLRHELDDIAELPDFQTLESEKLYQLFRGVFIPKDEMANQTLRCPLTREGAKSHLIQSYGAHYVAQYVDYPGTQEVTERLTRFLELPYDRLNL
jgi:hypothetical protein